jgi:P pilus assembly chaperone PapD
VNQFSQPTPTKIMKNILLSKTLLLALSLTAAVVLPRLAVAADDDEKEYSFVLHNTTKEKITGLMVSEDGEKWGKFDVGNGLNPGESAKFVWDKKTNSQECEQFVKAEFEDGSESKPVKHDFCKEGLELGF